MYYKTMKKKKIVTFLFIFLLVFIDQITKHVVSINFDLHASKEIIPNFFDITYNINYGAAFGILEGKRILFLIITVCVLGYLLYEIRKYYCDKLSLTAFILVIGGIIGNFIDRITLGYVRDFMDFTIFGYDMAIFNAADAFMVIGIIILFITVIKESKYENKKK